MEATVVVPVPSMVPLVQTSSLETLRSPAPPKVPLTESSNRSAVTALLRERVPPVTAMTPSPEKVAPASRVWVPILNSIRAPAATVKAPELVPPLVRSRVEVWTFTVPVLLNGMRMVVPAPADLVKVPALLNCGPVTAEITSKNSLFWTSKVAPGRLLKTVPWPMKMLPPVQVAVPALLMVRPRDRLVPDPLMSSVAVAWTFVVPEPLILPFHTSAPLTVRSPVPVRVPPSIAKFSAVTSAARETDPKKATSAKPAPVMAVPALR